jgi:hypothetical protein
VSSTYALAQRHGLKRVVNTDALAKRHRLKRVANIDALAKMHGLERVANTDALAIAQSFKATYTSKRVQHKRHSEECQSGNHNMGVRWLLDLCEVERRGNEGVRSMASRILCLCDAHETPIKAKKNQEKSKL